MRRGDPLPLRPVPRKPARIPDNAFTLTTGVTVHLDAPAPPPGAVYWTMSHVCLGFTPADREYSPAKWRHTVGSEMLWADELRFDAGTGHLRSFYLQLPTPTVRWEKVHRYVDLPLYDSGLLTLTHRRSFEGPIASAIAFDPAGSALIGLYPAERAKLPNRRLNIADGLDLLSDGTACSGWLLHRPAEVLVEGDREPRFDKARTPVAPEIPALVAELLALLQLPVFAADGQPNPELRRRLETLADAVRQAPESRATAVLLAHIRRQLRD